MLETPLSLVGYFSNLQKQLVLVTNERICKKIGGDRPFRLNFTYEHSAVSSIDMSCNQNMSELPCAMFIGSAIGVAVLPYRLAGLARETWRRLGSLALSFTGGPPDLDGWGKGGPLKTGGMSVDMGSSACPIPCSLMSISVVLACSNPLS